MDFRLIRNISMVFLGLFFLVFLMPTQEKTRNYVKEEVTKESYNGIVIKKYIDKSNHATPTVILKDGRELSFIGNIYDKINVGDSIVKFSGDIKMFIYRAGNKIELDNRDYYVW
ncbi:hypothetical protein [Flavobacterium sp.]|uniref:hypothetical protein n=1 Tax=Flavobacterium sp. TaxID=239 RepID=UPI004034F4C8